MLPENEELVTERTSALSPVVREALESELRRTEQRVADYAADCEALRAQYEKKARHLQEDQEAASAIRAHLAHYEAKPTT